MRQATNSRLSRPLSASTLKPCGGSCAEPGSRRGLDDMVGMNELKPDGLLLDNTGTVHTAP